MLLTVRESKVTRIDVTDNSLDLAVYRRDRNWPHLHNRAPKPPVVGVDRRGSAGGGGMTIGIVGVGRIGGNLAAQWTRRGHEVLVSFKRDPEALIAVAEEVGLGVGRSPTPPTTARWWCCRFRGPRRTPWPRRSRSVIG